MMPLENKATKEFEMRDAEEGISLPGMLARQSSTDDEDSESLQLLGRGKNDDQERPSSSSSAGAPNGNNKLEKTLGLWSGVAIIVGVMIGSGIFAFPGEVLKFSPSRGFALSAWIISGSLALTGALSYAELGTTIPSAGGEQAYLKEAYGTFRLCGADVGDLLSFMFCWTNVFVTRPASLAIICLVFGEYMQKFASGVSSAKGATAWGFGCMVLVTTINAVSVKAAIKTQDTLTWIKVIVLLAISGSGIMLLVENSGDFFSESPEHEANRSPLSATYGVALQGCLFAYDGWQNLNYVVEELKNPAQLPKALMMGVPTVVLLYFFVNMAYFAALPPSEVETTTTIGVDFARKVFPPFVVAAMPLLIALSALGSANGTIMSASRLVYASARAKQLPSLLAQVHSTLATPVWALVFEFAIGCALLLFGSLDTLLNYFGLAQWIFYFLTVLGLLILRRTRPEMARPYRVATAVPIVFCVTSAVLVVSTVAGAPSDSLVAIGFILAGGGVHACRVIYIKSGTVLQ